MGQPTAIVAGSSGPRKTLRLVAFHNSHGRRSSLTAAERELVLTIADDERHWHVFTDSPRQGRRLLRIAQAWGVRAECIGEGYEFTLPVKAVRFKAPPTTRTQVSDEQRTALALGRTVRQKPRLSENSLDFHQRSVPPASADGS